MRPREDRTRDPDHRSGRRRTARLEAMTSSSRPPAVIAHRGSSGHAPENTVAAFRLAVEQDADGIELDVRRTADGQLVVHHDARLPDGRAIIELTVEQLPAHVPDLTAALDACAGAWVNLEIKNDERDPDFDPDRRLATDVAELLAARPETPDRWLISSFDLATVDTVRAIAPGLPTAFLVLETTPATIAAAIDGGHRALHPWVAALDRAALDAAHAAGLQINAWTCNDEERMRELIVWGIDGICTDLPDVARRLLPRP